MLQFGTPLDGAEDRPAAFGIAERGNQIALVRIDGGWWDLPGGALDPGEDEPAAMIREFGEETGLRVRCGDLIVRAAQYFTKSGGQPVNNCGGVYEALVEAEAPELKIEDDHTLVWMDPREAVALLRHDSHAWAVTAWMRRRKL